MGFFSIIGIALQGYKALAAFKKPPPGSKTVVANFSVIIVWAIAHLGILIGIDIPASVVNGIVAIILPPLNIWLRSITKTPMGG